MNAGDNYDVTIVVTRGKQIKIRPYAGTSEYSPVPRQRRGDNLGGASSSAKASEDNGQSAGKIRHGDGNPQRLYAELVFPPTLGGESNEKIKSGLTGDREPRNQSGIRKD